ncbi:MAG: hypothetical protein J3Q66DRAFT_398530 [Benniella sp.]|nr:MAG: hypothetical protein J3Q66DRAFT_398530 [Benniella sp.]
MASLLCVNKTISAAALPFLYKDCLGLMMRRRFYVHESRLYVDRDLKRQQLARILLRQVHPQSRIPDILKVAYLSQDDQTNLESTAGPSQPPFVFKYGHFLHVIKTYYVI